MSHAPETPCPCGGCRATRRRRAGGLVEQVRAEINEITCSCVRRYFAETYEARESRAIIEEAEARFLVRTFTWETTGAEADQKEAVRGWSLLRDCWREASRGYDRRGEEHTCNAGHEQGRRRP